MRVEHKLQLAQSPEAGLRLKGCLGMGASAQPLTPKLMHVPHMSLQGRVVTIVAAEAAASV